MFNGHVNGDHDEQKLRPHHDYYHIGTNTYISQFLYDRGKLFPEINSNFCEILGPGVDETSHNRTN